MTAENPQHKRREEKEKRTACDLALIKAAQKGWSVTVWLACDVEMPFMNEDKNSFTGTVESVDRYFVKFVIADTREDSEQNSVAPWIGKSMMAGIVVHERKETHS